MAPPIYNLNHVTEHHPFMTCLVKVNTRFNWQKTVAGVLNKCHGVYSFRADDNGVVEISGTADPSLLLKKLGRAGRKADLQWFQFGECSSNLFMASRNQSSYNHDGRYLHSRDVSRPKIPSHEHIMRTSAHNRSRAFSNNNHPSYHHIHDYQKQHGYYNPHSYDQGHDFKHGREFCYDQTGHYPRTRAGDDMGCCIIM